MFDDNKPSTAYHHHFHYNNYYYFLRLTALTITTMSSPTETETETDSKAAKYGELKGTIVVVQLQKSQFGLGLFLAGNRDRGKMSVFVCGVHPRGSAHRDGRIQVGDEILEVNGNVLYGRCHLNASAVINTSGGPLYEITLLRRKSALDEMAVKPLTQFPVHLNEDDLPEESDVSDDLSVEEELQVGEGNEEEGQEVAEAAGLPTSSTAIPSSSPSVSLNVTKKKASQQKHTTSSTSPHNLTTLQVIETELNKKSGKGLGICLSSKVDDKLEGGSSSSTSTSVGSVFVSKLIKGGLADGSDGKIMEGDYILEVNGRDTRQSTHQEVVLLLKTTNGRIGLKVGRLKTHSGAHRKHHHHHHSHHQQPQHQKHQSNRVSLPI